MDHQKEKKLPQVSIRPDCLNLCKVCLVVAPDNLCESKDRETVSVKKQPESGLEIKKIQEAMRVCPANAIVLTPNETPTEE